MTEYPSTSDLAARIVVTHRQLDRARAVYSHAVGVEIGDVSPAGCYRVDAAYTTLRAATDRIDGDKALLLRVCRACMVQSERWTHPKGCAAHRALFKLD